MVLIRRTGGQWRTPEIGGHPDEKALQEIVKRAPCLLPGGSDGLAVVDELSVPGVGFVDLVGVGTDGRIVIVECKLRANPEIRREVVGQILAYASGLWRMTYESFDLAFSARSNDLSLVDSVAAIANETFDAPAFRDAVVSNLRAGAFRLVVAVDKITPELRSIVEYLNEHSTDNVQVLALELEYARDGDVELLTPVVCGEEAADRKERTASGLKWNEATFAAAIADRASDDELEFIQLLLAHGATRGHHPFYGTGATPGMSYYYAVDGTPTSLWQLYLYDTGSKVSVNLGAVSGRLGPERASQLLEALRANPVLDERLRSVTLNQYPSIPLRDVMSDAAVRATFFSALDTLLGQPTSTAPSIT